LDAIQKNLRLILRENIFLLKNLSDTSESGSGENLPILCVPFEIKNNHDYHISQTSTTASSSSAESVHIDQKNTTRDTLFHSNPNTINDEPAHIESDLNAISTLKEKDRRHSSSNLTSADGNSSTDESEFNIFVTNKIQSPDDSIVSSPPKKMTDALISRWDLDVQFQKMSFFQVDVTELYIDVRHSI
jgi:hypothetical protein